MPRRRTVLPTAQPGQIRQPQPRRKPEAFRARPSTRPPSYLPGGRISGKPSQYGQSSGYQQEERQRQAMPGLPAWAQDTYRPDMAMGLQPFGANLFRGNFASTYGNGMNDDT